MILVIVSIVSSFSEDCLLRRSEATISSRKAAALGGAKRLFLKLLILIGLFWSLKNYLRIL